MKVVVRLITLPLVVESNEREMKNSAVHCAFRRNNMLDIWEEWWRPACVLAMLKDMWSTRCRRACVRSHAKRHTGCNQPEADWLLSPINAPRPQLISTHPDLVLESFRGQLYTDIESTPREGSVQLNSSWTVHSFDDQVEVLSGVSSDPRVLDQSKFCSVLRREVRRTVQELKEVLPESRSVLPDLFPLLGSWIMAGGWL
ncbi:hypothetical protein F2Q69_00050677 [Brassica cretica]|uniref:Uncharacterized protein n=1 Tax=Brassica cretica TaxID=69181 RepID=A0A8S9PQC7_BRACR|nr:hypothetical protein F2Q69_00050677 [Brassica cretica]